MTLSQVTQLYDNLSLQISSLEGERSKIETELTKLRLIRESLKDQLKLTLKESSFSEIDSVVSTKSA